MDTDGAEETFVLFISGEAGVSWSLEGREAKARFLCPKKHVFTADSCRQTVTVRGTEHFKIWGAEIFWLWVKTK